MKENVSEKNLLSMIASYGYFYSVVASSVVSNTLQESVQNKNIQPLIVEDSPTLKAIEVTKDLLELTGNKFASSLIFHINPQNTENPLKTTDIEVPLGSFITEDLGVYTLEEMRTSFHLVSKINPYPKKGLSLQEVEKIFNPTLGKESPHLPKSEKVSLTNDAPNAIQPIMYQELQALKNKIGDNRKTQILESSKTNASVSPKH